MINNPSSQGGTGTGASSSSSSGNTGTAGHVQFRMTVKLDIEGHVPTASTTASATTADATSAAAQSTQDLLLKLQPLLPHLCISKDSATMLHRTLSAPIVEQQLRQVQEHVEAPASTTCDESGLELSLGLSMFKKSGTVNTTDTTTATDTSNINTVSCQPENSSLCWSSEGGGREVFQDSIEGKNQQQVALQHQPSNVGVMVRTDSMALEWRAMEEHRLKREAQYQRRQEARKKRRILIDEQKQQRKAAAAAARGACSSSVTSLIKQASRSMLGSDTNVTTGAADEQKQPHPQHEQESTKDEKVTMDESPTRKSKLGACDSRSCSKTRKRAKLQQQDSSTVTSGRQVKTEASEEVPATSTASVIRPSPIHEPNQEWVQKFLEMQSMVSKTPNSDEHEQQVQQRRGGFEEESISQRKQLRRMASLPGARMTRQGSLNLKRISSPPPVPPYRDTAMDSQCSSVCSSMPLATGLFSPPTTYSTLTVPNKGQVAQVATTRSVDPVGAPSSALLRSVSLGTYRSSNEQLQEQQQRFIEVPSPVRSSSNNALLLRTLSEGAALRALARAESADEKFASWQASSRLVNRNNQSSAFKSPKKEPSVTSCNTRGDTVGKPGEEAELPLVSTRGTGPNGKLVNGVLLAYKKGDVRIACACHGQHMTAKEFVEHAGGVAVSNPEKCIVVSPSKRARLHSQASIQ